MKCIVALVICVLAVLVVGMPTHEGYCPVNVVMAKSKLKCNSTTLNHFPDCEEKIKEFEECQCRPGTTECTNHNWGENCTFACYGPDDPAPSDGDADMGPPGDNGQSGNTTTTTEAAPGPE